MINSMKKIWALSLGKEVIWMSDLLNYYSLLFINIINTLLELF